ncbi:methionyl aminopeptidase [Arthrobacter stackebrandtii]|uniref:Methionine aminopeptidase n=1 Tax=Arthrobacter stackebrandtii TaxID=272161 RepID=A0ABS4YTQ3_9MICC|nr:type I methionyl aminopeptidase [Arthrobacter stackebrandtii]MBP2411845.1 methionyl aminopeptidase [Arthrobacter stackebrandtii]PYG99122.1 type I methionyl aminopeptidase [Arthrobacter stackebrandtii]
MIELHSMKVLGEMKAAGSFVASTLTALKEHAAVGVDLLELNAMAHNLIRERGATSCYLDYAPSFGSGPFGHVLCTSVNDAVLHGLPHPYRLRDGDLLTLDFAASVDGWVADSAISFVVGTARPEDLELIELTERALEKAISVAVVGNKIGDISYAIGSVAREAGLKVNMEFGGHGVGRTMHGDPFVANDGRPGRGFPLKPGLVIAIEPWFMRGTDKLKKAPDGWTLLSANGSRTAHSEHTIAITEDGPLVLTQRGN